MPHAADHMARMVVSKQSKDSLGDMLPEAVVLQVALSSTQLMVEAAGAAMGMIVDCRKEALEQGRLLPISAMATDTVDASKDGQPSSSTAQTFSAFTSGITTRSNISDLLHNLRCMDVSLSQSAAFLGIFQSRMAWSITNFQTDTRHRKKELEILQKTAISLAEPGAATAGTLVKVFRDPKNDKEAGRKPAFDHCGEWTSALSNQIVFTARRMKSLVKMAITVTAKTRRLSTYREHRQPASPVTQVSHKKSFQMAIHF